VVVSHRRSLTSRLDRVAVLRNGKIETFGHTDAVLARLGETPPRVVAFPAAESRVTA
jgi:ABC-type protease/lipase transport system fused ATPase/permease subunit